MFETIHALASTAKITSLNINVRLNADQQMVAIVSFLLPSFEAADVFDSDKSASQDFINLRAALSTPVVVSAPVGEIADKIQKVLADLVEPVVQASTALDGIDLKALLGKATAAASKATANKPSKGAAKAASSQVESEAEPDVEPEVEAVSVPALDEEVAFGAFDSL